MSVWTLALCAAGLAAGFALLWADYKRRQHEALNVERMRNSMLYCDLYPLVVAGKKHCVDRVLVERSRVVFYGLCPPGRIGEFVMAERGYRPLNSRRVWALVQLLAEEIPELQSNSRYFLRRYTVVRPNGQRDSGYQYVIRSAYKTALIHERQSIRLD